MQEVLKKIAPVLRELRFRGSGQYFRRSEDDFVFVINFQGSRWGDQFYVNLGAHPAFIQAEGDADLARLKEYECMLRTRVGKEWPWHMPDMLFQSFAEKIVAEQADFFAHARTLPSALASSSTDDLLRGFSAGTTEARAALHLARAAARLGYTDASRKLVDRGLELAGDSATILRAELMNVMSS